MKHVILLILTAGTIQLHAQKNIDGLINAEKSFAAYSVENGTKDAFLKFLDSAGIVFDQGKPVNGIAIWNQREKRPGVLNWHPIYAEIASSNDLGYTTGPWTFQRATVNDTIAARGQYTTVWHVTKNGEWKFLVDLGVGNTPELALQPLQPKHAEQLIRPEHSTEQEMLHAEKEFIEQYKKAPATSYEKYLSVQSILNRNGYKPAMDQTSRQTMINETAADIIYTINGSGISDDGSLGYVYGTAVRNGKPENYMRIWRNERGQWRIAVEVLRY
jgi:hypothetical protein